MSDFENVPLPGNAQDFPPRLQYWHEYDESSKRWIEYESSPSNRPVPIPSKEDKESLTLVTWNVDFTAEQAAERISQIIKYSLSQSPDIVFFQELSRTALVNLLADENIRKGWITSDHHSGYWGGHIYKAITLMSKARFGSGKMSLGRIWRVYYPSRYGRDALCCDIISPEGRRARFINVHLDSLESHPCRRPEQLSICAAYLDTTGAGMVAGDFNPVQAEDVTLVAENGLEDAWEGLHGDEAGFTWGVDGKARFPAKRMDKVATKGLEVRSIEILHPGDLQSTKMRPGEKQLRMVPWSDHSGLRCTFEL